MTQVKICGLTNPADALAAAEAGADLLGFIFYPPSPRYVAPETVREIITDIQQAARHSLFAIPQFVGVFVNESLPTVEKIFRECGLDRLQLHGDEPPEMVNHFEGRAYKALRPQAAAEVETLLTAYLADGPVGPPPRLLLDAYHPALYGGTGHTADWTLAADIAQRAPLLLAGSLTPANVAEAVRAVRPWGVDVSSGVEAVKGRKDHDKLRAFVAAVKGVAGLTINNRKSEIVNRKS